MKDAADRFGLEKYRVKIKKISESGNSYLVVLGFGVFFLFTTANAFFSSADRSEKEAALNQLRKVHKRKTI